MFGYVTINRNELSDEDFARYRSYYCGLCRALQKRHGFSGQLILSYDMVFLEVLLTSLYEYDSQSGTGRCVPHPTKTHTWLYNAASDYCADMSVALSYYNLMDNWEDDHSAASLIMAKRLRKRYEAVSERYPRQCAAIHYCLTQLGKCERSNCQDIDQVSGRFGQLMAEVLDVRRDMWSADLQEMGMALGKFIYLMDAYDDLEKDSKKGRFNALRQLADELPPAAYEQRCHELLTQQMGRCAQPFEMLPILKDTPEGKLLYNTIYSGVWNKYALVRKHREGRRHD